MGRSRFTGDNNNEVGSGGDYDTEPGLALATTEDEGGFQSANARYISNFNSSMARRLPKSMVASMLHML